MTRGVLLALALSLCFSTVGCRDGSARLQGRWKGVHADGVNADVQTAADTFATAMALDVKGDQLMVTWPADKQTGRYKVLNETSESVTISTDKDGPADPQTFLFIDENTMKWTVLPGKTITLVKQP